MGVKVKSWVVDELDHVLKCIAVYIRSEKGNMAIHINEQQRKSNQCINKNMKATI